MINDLGQKIKTMRKKMDLTQEQLAERLGVSFQTVSKWETNAAYPDISMFPILANFFDTTTDELLGVDLSKKRQKIGEYLAEYDRLSNLGKEKEKFAFIGEAYKEFPNDYLILEKYIWMLCYDPNHEGNGLLAHEDELFYLCNRILDECTIDKVRYSALSILSGLFRDKGNIEKALEYANRFPPYYHTVEQETENTYSHGTDKWWECVRKNIGSLTGNLLVKIRNCACYSDLSPEEQIKIFEKAITLLDLIYDEGDYLFGHNDLSDLHIWIACRYIKLKDYENAAKYLELGLSHAKTYDELPPVTVHTSFLVKGVEFVEAKVYSGFEGNVVYDNLGYIDGGEFYNEVREMEWFKNIIDKYRPFAKETK